MRLYDYAASANCLKVRLALALLDVPYERVAIDIFAGDTLTADFGGLNPLRETPVLELDDGRVLTQSNAILWHVTGGGPLMPQDGFERALALQWLAFEQERVMTGIGGARFRRMTGREALDPDGFRTRQAVGAAALDILDNHVRHRSWLVGDTPSLADLGVFAYAHVASDAGLDLAGRPSLSAWLGRIRALPGYVNDLEAYPENARSGAGRSIYD